MSTTPPPPPGPDSAQPTVPENADPLTKLANAFNEPKTPAKKTKRKKRHRGGTVLALGIIGLVVCFIFGIFAWVMGSNDLREMRAGRMDTTGRGLTQAGQICGIIGVLLGLLGVLIGLARLAS